QLRPPIPVLFRLPLYRGRVGVLHLDPVRGTPRAIRRVFPLRHDAFEAHLAGVGEDGRAVAFQMLVEAQAKAGFSQHTSKRGLADLKRIAPEVIAVQFNEVEGVEKDALVSAVVTDEIERGNAVLIGGDSLTINDA